MVGLIGTTLVFLSTPSARRATVLQLTALRHFEISIHALREEGDSGCGLHLRPRPYFYPRPPRGGRLGQGVDLTLQGVISIHALREEGDRW